jgi:hypothetical protein
MDETYTQNEIDNQASTLSRLEHSQKKPKNRNNMGRPIKSVPEPGSQAERMRILREAMGYQTQIGFAKRYGFSLARWNGYERGKAVSRLAAKQLVRQIPGLSTGWIEDGATGDLSTAMARRLGLLPPEGD